MGSPLLLLVLTGAVAFAPLTIGVASAACQAAGLIIEPAAGGPADAVMVTGHSFLKECNDTPTCGWTGSADTYRSIRLVLMQGKVQHELASVAPRGKHTFTATIRPGIEVEPGRWELRQGLESGPATLVAVTDNGRMVSADFELTAS